MSLLSKCCSYPTLMATLQIGHLSASARQATDGFRGSFCHVLTVAKARTIAPPLNDSSI
jgi:uncharacterized protein YdeI (BOF family)